MSLKFHGRKFSWPTCEISELLALWYLHDCACNALTLGFHLEVCMYMQGLYRIYFFVRHTLNNNIMMYNHVLTSQVGCVCWGGGRGDTICLIIKPQIILIFYALYIKSICLLAPKINETMDMLLVIKIFVWLFCCKCLILCNNTWEWQTHLITEALHSVNS